MVSGCTESTSTSRLQAQSGTSESVQAGSWQWKTCPERVVVTREPCTHTQGRNNLIEANWKLSFLLKSFSNCPEERDASIARVRVEVGGAGWSVCGREGVKEVGGGGRMKAGWKQSFPKVSLQTSRRGRRFHRQGQGRS